MCEALELRSIRHSVERLRQFPVVEDAVAAYGLELHGARFGIALGLLEWMDDNGSFNVIELE